MSPLQCASHDCKLARLHTRPLCQQLSMIAMPPELYCSCQADNWHSFKTLIPGTGTHPRHSSRRIS
eukprot:1156662-Pelagomonas_calceolata.AAC.14